MLNKILPAILPDQPGQIFDLAKKAAKLDSQINPRPVDASVMQRLGYLAGDIGAGIGVTTAALGGGLRRLSEKGPLRDAGTYLKKAGTGLVLDGDKSKLIGGGVLATGAAGAIGGGGLAANRLLNRQQEDNYSMSDYTYNPYRKYGGRYAQFAPWTAIGAGVGALGGILTDKKETNPVTGETRGGTIGSKIKRGLLGAGLGAAGTSIGKGIYKGVRTGLNTPAAGSVKYQGPKGTSNTTYNGIEDPWMNANSNSDLWADFRRNYRAKYF